MITLNGTASSAGRLQVQYRDGKIRVEGEGFLWRQSDSFLTISNHVSTVIEIRVGKDKLSRENFLLHCIDGPGGRRTLRAQTNTNTNAVDEILALVTTNAAGAKPQPRPDDAD